MPDGSDWPPQWDRPDMPKKPTWQEYLLFFLAFVPGLMMFFIPVGAVAAICAAVWISTPIGALAACITLLDVVLFIPVWLCINWLDSKGLTIG